MDEAQGFGAWLRGCMDERGLTQQQVADAIGVRQQTVSKYLAGDEIPRAERIDELAAILQKSALDVLDAVYAATGTTDLEPKDKEARRERLRYIEEYARRQRLELEDGEG